MARDALTITALSNLGAAQPSQLLGVAANDIAITPTYTDWLLFLEVENKGSASATATIQTPVTYDGIPVDDVAIAVPAPAQATLTTACAGANNDMTFTAVQRGTGGNGISVAYVVSGLSTALSIAITGLAVVVNVATDGAGVATSTAADIKTAWDASAAVNLATCANYTGNDGTGVVAAFAATNLAGGAESVYVAKLYTMGTFLQSDGSIYVDLTVDSTLYFRCYRF